jgi:hypothetical protein
LSPSNLEQALTIGIAVVTSIAGSVAAIGSLGYWLSGRFRYIERGYNTAIDRHEEIDQTRHLQNLAAFENIRLALAKAGMWGEK